MTLEEDFSGIHAKREIHPFDPTPDLAPENRHTTSGNLMLIVSTTKEWTPNVCMLGLNTTKKSPFRDGQNPSLNRSNPSLYGLRDGFRDGYCPFLKPLSLIRVRDGF